MSSTTSTWRRLQQSKRREELRKKEEKRRKRLLLEEQEEPEDKKESSSSSSSSLKPKTSAPPRRLPGSSTTTPTTTTTTTITTTPTTRFKRQSSTSSASSFGSPLDRLRKQKEKQQNNERTSSTSSSFSKRVVFPNTTTETSTNTATTTTRSWKTASPSIDKKWLDEKPLSSKSLEKNNRNETLSTENKSTKSFQATLSTASPAGPAKPPKPGDDDMSSPHDSEDDNDDDDDDDDDDGEVDLLAEFRRMKQQEKKQQSQPSSESQSTGSLKSVPPSSEQQELEKEDPSPPKYSSHPKRDQSSLLLSPSRSRSKPKPTKEPLDDTIQEFTPTPNDDIEDDSSSCSDPPEKRKSLDKSLMEDSSEDEEGENQASRISHRRRPNNGSIPHNPIALMNQQQKSIAESPTPKQPLNSDSLWSDSDRDEEEEKEERAQPKAKRKRKSKDEPSSPAPPKPSPRKKASATAYLEEEEDNDDIRSWEDSDLNQDEETLRKKLHPDMDDPKFGPYTLEPLILEQNGHRHEVPASLSRYLAPFQKEGVEFMYKCMMNNMGVALGDDMGCGKTVQVIALLSALFRKTGTAWDARELKQRRKLVRDANLIQKRRKEEALLKGQILPSTRDWISDLNMPEWYPVLIVVPPTVVKNWKNEFEKFAHFETAFFVGEKRDHALESIRQGRAEVLITSKSLFMMQQGFSELNTIPWKLVVLDEFHLYKNHDSIVSKNLRTLKRDHRCLMLGMTGTLMSNNHKELWNLIDLIETNFLGTWGDFEETYEKPIKNGRAKDANDDAIEKAEKKRILFRKKIAKIYIERKKENVLRDLLPEKFEKVLWCPLAPLQKQVYQHILTLPDFETARTAGSPCDCEVNNVFFRRLYRMRTPAERMAYYRQHKKDLVPRGKCCYTIPKNPLYGEPGQPYINPKAVIWKMLDAHENETACERCPTCCAFPALNKLYKVSDHLALIQAQEKEGSGNIGTPEHTRFMKDLDFAKVAVPEEIVEKLPGKFVRRDGIMDNHFALSGKLQKLDKLLKKHFEEDARVLLFSYSTQTLDLIQNYMRSAGYSFLRMDGGTPTSKRQELADRFNSDRSIFVFLLSTKAMGVGLNLTGANRVIIFDVEWNPSHDSQAQDRAYRIGQKKDVEVTRLVSEGTIDELKYLRQLYKLQLKQDTLEDSTTATGSAPRMFKGIQGDKDRKGELFGLVNLFRFKDGKFLDDIWKGASVKSTKKNEGLEIQEASKLSDQLMRVDAKKCEEVFNGDSSELEDLLRNRAALKDGEWKSKGNPKQEYQDNGEENENSTEKNDGNMLDHQDLFRSDRGRAAIEEGEEGFDEEMGGETQNMVNIYEGGVNIGDNPQDGGSEDDEPDEPHQDVEHQRVEDYNAASVNANISQKTVRNVEQPVVPPLGTNGGKYPPPLPSAGHRSEEINETSPQNVKQPRVRLVQQHKSRDGNSGDSVSSKPRTRAMPRKRASTTSPKASKACPNIQIVGKTTNRIAKGEGSTTFTAADLALPTYGRKKRKKIGKKL